MTGKTRKNSEFAAVEGIITNRADGEGILLREGILFSAEERERVFTHFFGQRSSLNFSSVE